VNTGESKILTEYQNQFHFGIAKIQENSTPPL